MKKEENLWTVKLITTNPNGQGDPGSEDLNPWGQTPSS